MYPKYRNASFSVTLTNQGSDSLPCNPLQNHSTPTYALSPKVEQLTT